MPDPHDPRPPFPGTTTALVVDDVGIVRRLAFRLLSEAGLRVFEAATAVEALEVLEMARGRIDLVLVDVILGEINGVDFVRLIRERWAGPRIVFMSAHPAEVLVREGLDNPNVLFLAKPFTRDELLQVIRRALRRSPVTSEVRRPNEI
ncbi:MAG TPA: response regulator [Gemmatimonadales bacterium]|nr:response regulator [Gemmatimonadales bacterium]